MDKKTSSQKVLLFLSGGVSAENQIALLSAQNVYPHIDREFFDVVPVFIAPDGQWLLLPQQQNWLQLLEPDAASGLEPVELLPLSGGLGLRTASLQTSVDLIFPMLHGPFGEDGTIQGLAEFFGVPMLGSDMSGSLMNMDKVLMKAILELKNIPSARYRSFCRTELGKTGLQDQNRAEFPQTYAELAAELFTQWQCLSLFVKPARMGSSIGMSQVKYPEDLTGAVHLALQYDDKLLIEEGFCALELELAVMELGTKERRYLQVSNAAQIRSNGKFYSYEQKYFPEKQEKAFVVEAHNNLPPEVIERARNLATEAFFALGVRHYCRVDLFYLEAEDRLLLNEINTIPGFTAHSMFPKLMEAEGWPMQRLVPHLLQLALQRASS